MKQDMTRTITEMLQEQLYDIQPLVVKGRVIEVIGTMIKAVVPSARIGELCILRNESDNFEMEAEVVGFSKEAALLTPLRGIVGVVSGTDVIPTGKVLMVPVGQSLLGRVIDGLGKPLDEKNRGPLEPSAWYPVYRDPPNPLDRNIISRPMSLGIRAIDGLLTCGEGQRIGVFAAAGGGKSTLLSMMVRNAAVDVAVVALIGERGREVREFIERDLGPEGLSKSVVVVSTSDKSPMERLKAAYVATAVAEYFRDQNKRVLLLMDSVTRFARAQREIGLATGEPPARRGFPPSVFSVLPQLMERAGPAERGSITAIYTVLVEGDDMTEPVADETRSILDGHIVLSRKLASANHYPAIDILQSVSRVMNSIVKPEHRASAGQFRNLLSKYQEIELLLQLGEYKAGADPLADKAVAGIQNINRFLQQGTTVKSTFDQAIKGLREVVA